MNSQETRQHIVDTYIRYLLENGKRPNSIYLFAKELGLSEAEFYNYFTSFEGLDADVWLAMHDETVRLLHSEEVYQSYTIREKLLAYLYTAAEVWKQRRSFILSLVDAGCTCGAMSPTMKPLKHGFMNWAKQLVNEGIDKGEILQRPLVTDKYADALWLQTNMVLRFWIKDTSPGFDQTDALIEKSVNLSMDLLGQNTLDHALDLAKFLVQTR